MTPRRPLPAGVTGGGRLQSQQLLSRKLKWLVGPMLVCVLTLVALSQYFLAPSTLTPSISTPVLDSRVSRRGGSGGSSSSDGSSRSSGSSSGGSSSSINSSSLPKPAAIVSPEGGVQICFVIRTYWAHGRVQHGSLRSMLDRLVTHPHKK